MESTPIDGLTLFFDEGERDAVELLCHACEKSARLIHDCWGLDTPDDCRVYIMTSWLHFIFHSAPWLWLIPLAVSMPFWYWRTRKLWEYAGGWAQRYGKRRAVGVKPPRLIQVANRSIGERIFIKNEDVGERVRRVREQRGLSLLDISQRTGLDVEQLSQIEEGDFSPPLGTMTRLAKSLEMKLGYFISGEARKPYTIVRRADRKVVSRYGEKKGERYGYEYQSLAPQKKDRHMEPFLVTLAPSEIEEERSTHDGQEFIFVLQGKMEVRLGDEVHFLEPGDAIYYDSTVPHLVKGHGDEPTRILAVLYIEK